MGCDFVLLERDWRNPNLGWNVGRPHRLSSTGSRPRTRPRAAATRGADTGIAWLLRASACCRVSQTVVYETWWKCWDSQARRHAAEVRERPDHGGGALEVQADQRGSSGGVPHHGPGREASPGA